MNIREGLIALRSGTGRHGFGFVSTESGALQSHPFSVESRFNGVADTSP
jgi:hypothetical protein